MLQQSPIVVDLFCGVGGLTHGLMKEGLEVVAGYDADTSCKYAYEANNKAEFYGKRIEDLKSKELNAHYPYDAIKILVGCAPCQPFSSYSNSIKQDNAGENPDNRWKLLDDFANLAIEVSPEIISMENVTRLRSFDDGRVFQRFVRSLNRVGYQHTVYHVYGPSYGIPQKRRRLVFFASKFGPLELAPPTHIPSSFATVRSAIENLPVVEHGEVDANDPLHRARRLSDKNLARIHASNPGGTWEDWDENLLAPCHKRKTGASYKSVYGRMEWDQPSPTITTQFYGYGSGRFGHPEQHRALTLREGAILQTFPPEYKFLPEGEKASFHSLGRQIGNAVPVALGEVIARSIKSHLDRYVKA